MPRRGDTKHDLTLRPVTGLLEDVALAVPVEWVETLRAQSVKLGMSLEDVGRPRFVGHLAHEVEVMEEAVQAPSMDDDPTRVAMRGGLAGVIPARITSYRATRAHADDRGARAGSGCNRGT